MNWLEITKKIIQSKWIGWNFFRNKIQSKWIGIKLLTIISIQIWLEIARKFTIHCRIESLRILRFLYTEWVWERRKRAIEFYFVELLGQRPRPTSPRARKNEHPHPHPEVGKECIGCIDCIGCIGLFGCEADCNFGCIGCMNLGESFGCIGCIKKLGAYSANTAIPS